MGEPVTPESDLDLIPRGVRDKLDRIGVKLHLRDWQAMPLLARVLLRDLPCQQEDEVARYRGEVERLVIGVTGHPPEKLKGNKP